MNRNCFKYFFILAILVLMLLYNFHKPPLEVLPDNSLMSYKHQKFIVLSFSVLSKRDYYFFQLPMIVRAWQRLDFNAIVLIVSAEFPIKDKLALKTIEFLIKYEAILIEVKIPANYEVMVSQTSRIFLAFLDDNIIDDNDFIMTSDSDLYPFRSNHLLDDIELNKENKIFLWNAFCCGQFSFKSKKYTMYPMMHIGMKKKLWKSVMNLNLTIKKIDGHKIVNELARFFNGTDHLLKTNYEIEKGDKTWYMDQTMISVKIEEYANKFSNVALVKMSNKGNRLERGYNSKEFYNYLSNPHLYTDFHSFQSDVYKKLDELDMIFLNLFDKNSQESFKNYINQFMKLKNNLFL